MQNDNIHLIKSANVLGQAITQALEKDLDQTWDGIQITALLSYWACKVRVQLYLCQHGSKMITPCVKLLISVLAVRLRQIKEALVEMSLSMGKWSDKKPGIWHLYQDSFMLRLQGKLIYVTRRLDVIIISSFGEIYFPEPSQNFLLCSHWRLPLILYNYRDWFLVLSWYLMHTTRQNISAAHWEMKLIRTTNFLKGTRTQKVPLRVQISMKRGAETWHFWGEKS